MVGDGPHRAELERCFAGKNANFVGYLKGVQLAEAYASADAFVYASEVETMGNVVLGFDLVLLAAVQIGHEPDDARRAIGPCFKRPGS